MLDSSICEGTLQSVFNSAKVGDNVDHFARFCFQLQRTNSQLMTFVKRTWSQLLSRDDKYNKQMHAEPIFRAGLPVKQ